MKNSYRAEAEGAAYIRLEVDPAVVAAAPKISHLFKHVPGGVKAVWEILETCELPDARRLLEFRNRLNATEQKKIPFEAIVIAAGMTPKHAFGVVSEAIVEHSQDAARLILHAATPKIMKAAVDRSTKFDGTADGKMLLQATNMVARPKNTVVIHNGDVVKGNKNSVEILPSVEDTGRRLGDRFNMEMTVPMLAAPEPVDFDEEGEEEPG